MPIDDPGSFLDPSLWPLFLQSAMMQAPPQMPQQQQPSQAGDLLRAYLGSTVGMMPGIGLGVQQALNPAQSMGEIGTRAAAHAASMVPVPIARMIGAAPKTATAAGIASVLGLGTGEAGEPTAADLMKPTEAEAAELTQLAKDLALKRREISRTAEGGRRWQQLNDEINRLQGRIDVVNRGIDQRRERITGRQIEEGAAQRERTRKAEAPFREEYPTAYRTLPLVGWGASALGGFLGGRGGRPIGSMIGGAVAGIPTSATAAIAPTAYDAATLPVGSQYQKEAADLLSWPPKPEYWFGRVFPEVMVGSGLGATMGKWRSLMGGRGGPSGPGQTGPASPAPAPSLPPSGPPSAPAAPSPPPPVFDPKLNRGLGGWRDPITGNITRAPQSPWPRPMMGP